MDNKLVKIFSEMLENHEEVRDLLILLEREQRVHHSAQRGDTILQMIEREKLTVRGLKITVEALNSMADENR